MDWASGITALQAIQHELLLLCVVFFTLGALDDLGFDVAYIGFRLTGRLSPATPLPSRQEPPAPLAIFVPAWQEAEVIAPTLRRMQAAWGRDAYAIYIGCYCNDPDTIAAAMCGVAFPDQARIVVNPAAGPTTKGDCLNHLWRAMEDDEFTHGVRFTAIILHDAEDWVHRDELALHRHYLPNHAMVQTPVVPFIPEQGDWVAGHYADEFVESHSKTLRVRHRLGGSLPAAGVGCAFDRDMMHFIAQDRGGQPFSCDSLVEDYELGLLIHSLGGRPILAYHRDAKGDLIATRALFPTHLTDAVRQKTRWLTGIALAGWDRLGWRGGWIEYWMRLHDRRSILSALVLAMGYVLMVVTALLWGLGGTIRPNDPALIALTTLCGAMLFWRIFVRAVIVRRFYGLRQAVRSVVRQPLANAIAIMAARRAVVQYARHCLGRPLQWDKTTHRLADHAAVRDDGALE